MLLYAILMFVFSLLFLGFGVAICRGNTKLIHDYHQEHIKEQDLPAYGRAFSRGMFAIFLTLAAAGAVALLGESGTILAVSLAILFVGLVVSIVIIVKAQKKYNGGLF